MSTSQGEKKNAVIRRLVYVISAIVIIFRLWILKYTVDLRQNNCECAIDQRLLYIQFAIIVSIILMFIRPFYQNSLLKLIAGLISFSYVVVGIWYIRDMKATECVCSEHLARTVLEYVLYAYAAIYFIMFVIILFMGNTIATAYFNESSSLKSSRPRSKSD
jgi:hypothetical protein